MSNLAHAAPPATAPAASSAKRELTLRAILTSVVVAAVIGASYPYVVLKIGYGPNMSVVSAFFGYIILSVVGFITSVRATRLENNLVQTAGTAAGQSSFMCVVLAAIDMLESKPELGLNIHLTGMQIFVWLSLAGIIGVLLAVPLRKHYIDEEDLPFPDGLAAGETLLVLDQGPKEAKSRVTSLGVGMGLSGLIATVRDGFGWLPGELAFGQTGHALRMGSEVSLLSFGSGMLVGLRVTLSMGLGMLVSWVIAPGLLVSNGVIAEAAFTPVLRWVMWPATGLLVAGGVASLALKWRVVARSFTRLSAKDMSSDDLPMKWVVSGVLLASVALAVVQTVSLQFPMWLSLVSLVVSFALMLVGIRVLGETNWAPISALANFTQVIFAALSPGNIAVNMIGSGMSGTIAGNGETLMQDYKAGKIVGSTNKNLTLLQLIGVPVGAAAVALVYPALKLKYGIGENGLTSPISVKWAGFGELVAKGFESLPAGCFVALWVAVGVGVLFAVLEPRYHRFVPSPSAIGIGMLVPGFAIMPMVLGGITQYVWQKVSPKSEEVVNLPLSSGLIAGEALVVLVLAVWAMINQ
jgi:putative OPT family oligopeptide transporter